MATRSPLQLEQLESRDTPATLAGPALSSDYLAHETAEAIMDLISDARAQADTTVDVNALQTELNSLNASSLLKNVVSHYGIENQVADIVSGTGITLENVAEYVGSDGIRSLAFHTPTAKVSLAQGTPIDFERDQAFSISVWAKASDLSIGPDDSAITLFEKGNFNQNQASYGFAIRPHGNQINAWLQGQNNGNRIYLSVQLESPVTNWHLYTMSYDGSSSANGLKIFVDGKALTNVLYAQSTLTSSIRSSAPGTIQDGFVGDRTYAFTPAQIRSITIHNTNLDAPDVTSLYSSGSEGIAKALTRRTQIEHILSTQSAQREQSAQMDAAIDSVLASIFQDTEESLSPTLDTAALLAKLDALEKNPALAGIVSSWEGALGGMDTMGKNSLTPTSAVGTWENSFLLSTPNATLTAPSSADFDLESDQPFTISAWAKMTGDQLTVDSNAVVFWEKGDFNQNKASYGFNIRPNGKVAAVWLQGSTNANRMYRGFTLPEGIDLTKPHHYLATYNGSRQISDVKVYIDGVELGAYYEQNTLTTSIRSSSQATVNDGFLGDRTLATPFTLEQLNFYNAALPGTAAQELKNMGSSGFHTLIADLVQTRAQVKAARDAGMIAPEMAMISPKYWVTGSGDYLTVHFEDMPEYARFTLSAPGNATYTAMDIDIPAGSGTYTFRVNTSALQNGVEGHIADARTGAILNTTFHLPHNATQGFQITQGVTTVPELAHLLPKDPKFRTKAEQKPYSIQGIDDAQVRQSLAVQMAETIGIHMKSAWEIGMEQHPELFGKDMAASQEMAKNLALQETGGVWTSDTGRISEWKMDSLFNLLKSYNQTLNYAYEMYETMLSNAFHDALLARAGVQNPSKWNGVVEHLHKNEVGALNILPSAEMVIQGIEKNFEQYYNQFVLTSVGITSVQAHNALLLEQGVDPATHGLSDFEKAAYARTKLTQITGTLMTPQKAQELASNGNMVSALSAEARELLKVAMWDEAVNMVLGKSTTGIVSSTRTAQLVMDTSLVNEIDLDAPITPEQRSLFIKAINTVSKIPKETLFAELINLYEKPASSDLPSIMALDAPYQFIRTDTTAGKIFMGLYQKSFSKNDEDILLLFAKAQKVLDIRYTTLWNLAKGKNFQVFARGLHDLFVKKGLANIFVNSKQMPPLSELPIQVLNYQKAYTNGNIQLSIDQPLDGRTPIRIDVYAKGNNNGFEVNLGGLIKSADSRTFSVSVPVDEIGRRIRMYGYSGPIKLGIVLWFDEKNSDGSNQKLSNHTDWLLVAWNGKTELPFVQGEGLSTLSDIPENAERIANEKVMLAQLKENFVFDLESQAAKTMRAWLVGSGYHHGDSYNAVDLDIGSNTEVMKQYVRAIANGTIGSIDPVYGTITLNHSPEETGTKIAWKSEYMHLLLRNSGRKELDSKGVERIIYEILDSDMTTVIKTVKVGDYFKAQENLAKAGGTGPSGFTHYKPHSHFRIYYTLNGGTYNVDLRNVLLDKDINFTVTTGSGSLGWVDGLAQGPENGSWVNYELKLVLDRRPQAEHFEKGVFPAYWLAWEEGKSISEMKKVVKDSETGLWLSEEKPGYYWHKGNWLPL